jgi:[acyl-carrier-protein] S-malonyltransferase
VVGLGDADLEAICAGVRAASPGSVCQLANFLFPQGRVVSGGWADGSCISVAYRMQAS